VDALGHADKIADAHQLRKARLHALLGRHRLLFVCHPADVKQNIASPILASLPRIRKFSDQKCRAKL
jgi:hypothetical protein